MVALDLLRPGLFESVTERHPDLPSDGHLCGSCLRQERTAYVLDELERDRGSLSEVETEISRKAAEHLAISQHVDEAFEGSLSLGQRLADAIARVGGSWAFVIGFVLVLLFWVALNSWMLSNRAFDPYPFILLNLFLSCLAAIQAPIIMMSQGRTAARDRVQADLDYRVNLKAEIEIAALHEKIDHLRQVQWAHLVDAQQTQLDLLRELSAILPHVRSSPTDSTRM